MSAKVKRNPPKPTPVEKPSAEEYAVASYMREHVPRKKTKFLHHPVEYFTAARAVDALLDSPWASGADKRPLLFTDRESVVAYLDEMLRHKFFHRAKKLAISDRDLRRKQLKKLKKLEEEEKKKVSTKDGESESEHDERKAEDKSNAEETAGEKSAVEGEASPKATSRKETEEGKPKRRIKLDMHLEQVFVDGNDAYVWIYDPIPKHYWLLGALLVGAIIAVCLFPLWPSKMREGVYYLSMAAAGFLVVIMALAVVRTVVFYLLWLLTWGRHHLWLLPNLTEDVGFFASFWPLYQYEYHGKKEKSSDVEKIKKKKKEKSEEATNKVSWETKEENEEEDQAGGEQEEVDRTEKQDCEDTNARDEPLPENRSESEHTE